MNILSNLNNFLYCKDNFIALFDNKVYLYNILKIDLLSEDLTIIELDNKIITIKGKNITTYKYCNNEIILSGLIESININESKNNN